MNTGHQHDTVAETSKFHVQHQLDMIIGLLMEISNDLSKANGGPTRYNRKVIAELQQQQHHRTYGGPTS